MNQEKRVMLALGLSLVILLVAGPLLFPPKPATNKLAPAEARTGSAPPSAASKAAPSPPRQTTAPAKLQAVAGNKAEEIVVESDLYRVTFSTEGAVVKSWVLKKYGDAQGQPLDLVDGPACEKLGYPMSVSLPDPELTKQLNSAVYVATPSSPSLTAPAKIELVYSDGKIQAKKQFSFGAGYEAHVEMSVFDGQKYLPVEATWPGGIGDHSLPDPMEEAASQAFFGIQEKIERVAARKVDADRSVPGPLDMVGVEDRYFAGAFLPGSPNEAFRFGRREWTPVDWKGKDKPKPLTAMLGSVEPKPLAFRLFVGPKDLDVLRTVSPPLDSLIDFGWFTVVAKPLLRALQYIYDHWVHNYGWAIVILTVAINLLMFPLKVKSIRSAQEMQRISPLVKGIQDKYKQYKFNDPRKQKMNQEIMELYKQHHINPFGSCLPMVLQLPFLYAFYRVLDYAIELRHAPWIWWIKDLSAPDKFHPFGIPVPILPTIMVISMFIMQKMTPMATADPAQQRMMMIMPIAFGIMFYNFASGLVLYFLTANLVGIAQQLFINKTMPLPDPLGGPRKPPQAKE